MKTIAGVPVLFEGQPLREPQNRCLEFPFSPNPKAYQARTDRLWFMWDAEVDGLNPNPPHTLESGFVTGLQGQHPIAVNAAALFRQPEGIALVMEAVRKFHGRMVPGGAKWEIWAKRTFIH